MNSLRGSLMARGSCTVAMQMGMLLVAACTLVNPDSVQANTVATADQLTVVLVVGAAGNPEYHSNFVHQVEGWQQTLERASAKCVVIGEEPDSDVTDKEVLQRRLQAEPHSGSPPLWLVMIGHGTFDGKIARFNLRGPDITPVDLSEWLQPFTRPLVIINTASASAPFLNALAGTNRVVVTATRSGDEQNFARFGGSLAGALADPESDLDRDDQVSLLEAFLMASARVEEFYQTEGRLVTEHALLDDNGDGKGTPADWFRGVRAVKSAKDGALVDGDHAHQLHLVLSNSEQALPATVRAGRDELELRIFSLRNEKEKLPATEYYGRLEELLLQLARLYQTNVPLQPELGFE